MSNTGTTGYENKDSAIEYTFGILFLILFGVFIAHKLDKNKFTFSLIFVAIFVISYRIIKGKWTPYLKNTPKSLIHN